MCNNSKKFYNRILQQGIALVKYPRGTINTELVGSIVYFLSQFILLELLIKRLLPGRIPFQLNMKLAGVYNRAAIHWVCAIITVNCLVTFRNKISSELLDRINSCMRIRENRIWEMKIKENSPNIHKNCLWHQMEFYNLNLTIQKKEGLGQT